MILIIDNVNLTQQPKQLEMPGEEPIEDNRYNIYTIGEHKVDDWEYYIKTSKFYKVIILNNKIYSDIRLDTSQPVGIYIDKMEKIKRDITYKGKIARDEMLKVILENESKINNQKGRIDILARYSNLNI